MTQPLKQQILYTSDFYAWTQDQAQKLRARAAFDNRGDVDWENAAEEIEGLGRSQRSEIRSRLLVILLHLLKWTYQRERRSAGWKGTLVEQRDRVLEEIEDSPSLRDFPASVVDRQYRIARIKAADETGISETVFPTVCPFTIEDILDPEFFPEAMSQ